MHATLRFLIMAGLIVWLFLMYEKTHPIDAFNFSFFENARTSAKCATYATTTDAGTSMDYRDRVRQVLDGCW